MCERYCMSIHDVREGGGGVSGVCVWVPIETFGGCPHSVSDQNIILCPCIILWTWPTHKNPISDLNHKLPYYRPGPQIVTSGHCFRSESQINIDVNRKSIPKLTPYFIPGSQIKLAIFLAWPTNRHWPEFQISTKIDPLLKLKYLRLLKLAKFPL